MKKSYIASAILGSAFFAVPYLALGIPWWTCTIMAGAAYGAGMLLFKGRISKDLELSYHSDNLYDILKQAKENTASLREISKQLENTVLVNNVKEICNISDKIITTLSKKPEKLKQANNFLNYYLPVTIKILKRYDEIENQKLTSKDSANFMNSIQEMIIKIKEAFNSQLNNLYQSDMIDTDAEIKVFEAMLKMDGFTEQTDFDLKKEE